MDIREPTKAEEKAYAQGAKNGAVTAKQQGLEARVQELCEAIERLVGPEGVCVHRGRIHARNTVLLSVGYAMWVLLIGLNGWTLDQIYKLRGEVSHIDAMSTKRHLPVPVPPIAARPPASLAP